MKLLLSLCCAFAIVATTSVFADNKKTDVPMLIEPDDLSERLEDSGLRIIDTRSKEEYAESHIPGAVHVDVAEWKNLAGAEGGFTDASGWAKQLGTVGISNKTRVVVYGNKLSNTARIWWLLKYVGVKQVSILNGGWDWWNKNDRQVQASTPTVESAEFAPDFQADRLAEYEDVTKSLNDNLTKVVDTRSDGEFDEGRVPGAVHLEWTHLLADDGRLKPKAELEKLFRENGIVPDETAVCY